MDFDFINWIMEGLRDGDWTKEDLQEYLESPHRMRDLYDDFVSMGGFEKEKFVKECLTRILNRLNKNV